MRSYLPQPMIWLTGHGPDTNSVSWTGLTDNTPCCSYIIKCSDLSAYYLLLCSYIIKSYS